MTKNTTFIKVADSFKAVGNKIKNLFTKKQNLGHIMTQFKMGISINYITDLKTNEPFFIIVDNGKIVTSSKSYSELFYNVAKNAFGRVDGDVKEFIIFDR